MKFTVAAPFLVLAHIAALFPSVSAEPILQSLSLNTCQDKSDFSASLFNITVSPNARSVSANIATIGSVQGYVVFDVALRVYGYEYIRRTIDPCDMDLQGLCPMKPGNLAMDFTFGLGDALDQVPNIAYSIPDLDATVRAHINRTDTGESVACVEAAFSNGKTVDLLGVKWATAGIGGLGLVSAAIVSLLGYTNTAAHLAANTLSLFGYFQAQAILGLTGIKMPPIVQAWTQNFQWSMGIVHVGWIQRICTWYQRSTGGNAANLFDTLSGVSVQVSKRSVAYTSSLDVVKRGVSTIAKRANIKLDNGSFIVYGIQRVAFRAKIETTNVFLTSLITYLVVVLITAIIVIVFKGVTEFAAKRAWMKNQRFLEFRRDWQATLKGIVLRFSLIGFPPIAILSMWEFTQADSPALLVLAVFFLVGTLLTLAWASFRVIRIAKRSIAVYHNPAYVLFSNPQLLDQWGVLYIQFRATAYYFVVPLLVYVFTKSAVIAFGQHNGVGQAIALIVIEAIALIATSVLRPWMDKSTNSFNISIYAFNFVNAVFLFLFTNVLDAPGLVVGVVGVVLFVMNAAFSLVLLLMIIISAMLLFWRKDPDARYQFMADDRTSFMTSQTKVASDVTNQLDSLAVTARGEKAGNKSVLDLDDDDSIRQESRPAQGSADPLFRAEPQTRSRLSSPHRSQHMDESRAQSIENQPVQRGPNHTEIRSGNNSSPWQRGAGYDG